MTATPMDEVVPGREVRIHHSKDALAAAIADAFARIITRTLTVRGAAHVVLTGGSMGAAFLDAVAQRRDIDWERVHLWWGDERFVAPGSADRNDAQYDAVADRLPGVIVHRMPTTADAGDTEAAATLYARDLGDATVSHGLPVAGAHPRFDLVMLGLGPDTHVASLFPGHPATEPTDADVVAVADSPKPPPERTTLTAEAITNAEQVWLMVSGADKADAVASASRAAEGSSRGDDGRLRCPGGAVTGVNGTVWWLDEAAAEGLPGPR